MTTNLHIYLLRHKRKKTDIALSYTAAPAGVFNPDFNNCIASITNRLVPLLPLVDGALGSNPELGDYSTTFW